VDSFPRISGIHLDGICFSEVISSKQTLEIAVWLRETSFFIIEMQLAE
jgi:hypothetical protein